MKAYVTRIAVDVLTYGDTEEEARLRVEDAVNESSERGAEIFRDFGFWALSGETMNVEYIGETRRDAELDR